MVIHSCKMNLERKNKRDIQLLKMDIYLHGRNELYFLEIWYINVLLTQQPLYPYRNMYTDHLSQSFQAAITKYQRLCNLQTT